MSVGPWVGSGRESGLNDFRERSLEKKERAGRDDRARHDGPEIRHKVRDRARNERGKNPTVRNKELRAGAH